MKDIYDFPLSWRWTQDTHTVLPENVLKKLCPLNETDASQLDSRLVVLFKGENLDTEFFHSIKSHDASDSSTNFLSELGISVSLKVLLSWNEELALATTWDIFSKYWTDFCYPSSDDLFITPFDDAWLLFFHHEKIFKFGVRKK